MFRALSRRLVVGLMWGAAGLSSPYAVLSAAAQPAPAPESPPVASPAGGQDRCAALVGHFDLMEILSAQTQPRDAAVPGTASGFTKGEAVAGLSSFCRVVGKIRPEPGSDINFEVWMPAQGWDGRLNGVGNGGFAGSITYSEMADAIRAGQATVSTDTGHKALRGQEPSAWAKGRPELVRDYGWRAIHLSAVAAKKLIASYYGRVPNRSYFSSCSNGGRQALMEANRFPQDYDGIVAGSPAALFTDVVMTMMSTVKAQLPPGAAIRPEQAKLLQERVLADCDAIDGQVDGLVADPRKCRVDVAKLVCGASASPLCFTAEQAGALRKIYLGPRDSAGRLVAPALLPSGAEVGVGPQGNWDAWVFGTPKTPPADTVFPRGLLQDLAPTPITDTASFDFNNDPARLKAAVGGDLDVDPDMRKYFARGGKLIMYHGWADAGIPATATIQFYHAVLRTSGSRAKDSTRLFVIPGMQHCFGGPGPNSFGQLTAPRPGTSPERHIIAAMQAWVETGRKPDSIIAYTATSLPEMLGGPPAGPRKERLVCAEPMQAVLRKGAPPDQAYSYSCANAT